MSAPSVSEAVAEKSNLQKEIRDYSNAVRQKKGSDNLSPGDTKTVLSQLKNRMKRVVKAIKQGKEAKKSYGRTARRGGR